LSAVRRLIVTRPQPQAQSWVEQLASLTDWRVDAMPLIETHSLAAQSAALQPADAWMFVSAAAVDAWWGQAGAESVPAVWVTGGGSAQAVRAREPLARIVLPDSPANWDSEGLWAALLAQGALDGVRCVRVLRGRDAGAAHEGNGREWLSERLREHGVDVQTLAVYERRKPDWSAAQRDAAQAALRDGSVWLLTSSQAVDHLVQLAGSLARAHALATHPRVAERARAAGFAQVDVCEPGLDSIARWCAV
jgi:uroporphyrinogen-III synthase